MKDKGSTSKFRKALRIQSLTMTSIKGQPNLFVSLAGQFKNRRSIDNSVFSLFLFH